MSTMGYVSTMEGAEDAASLSLDFEKHVYKVAEGGAPKAKGLLDIVTFSRSTSAGRWNDKGLYEMLDADQPRLDFDPITKALKGLLIEEQRTNLVKDSGISAFTSIWVKSPGVVVGTPGVAPDGTLSATSVANTVGASSYLQQASVVPSAGVYTVSFFCKPQAGYPFSLIFEFGSAGGGNVYFNAVTKAFTGGSPISTSYTLLPDGWMRASITASLDKLAFYLAAYGTSNVENKGYVWGVQVEAATFSTSYIPTPVEFSARASTATYFDSRGVLLTAGVGAPRVSAFDFDSDGTLRKVGLLVESAGTNLIKRAGELTNLAPWGYVGLTMEGVVGLDGGVTATRLTESVTTSVKEVRQQLALSAVAGTTYTYSVYAKPSPGADRQLRVGFGNGGIITGGAQGVFNLKDRTLASSDGVTVAIQKMRDGWARYSVTVTATNTASVSLYLTLLVAGGAGYTGDGVSGCIIYGPQVEVGSAVTSYIKAAGTFTSRSSTATYVDKQGIVQTAAVNVARDNAYAYDGAGVLRPIGLLLESAATNLLTNSTRFDTNVWGKNQVTVADTAEVAPDNVSLYKSITNQVTGTPSLYYNSPPVSTTSVTTFSVYVKAGTSDRCTLRFFDAGGSAGIAHFNLSTGVLESSTGAVISGASITPAGRGSYRISLSVEYGTRPTTSSAVYLYVNFSGSVAGDSVYAWGAQLEVGRSPTAYIPTTGATATRAADVFNAVTSTRAGDSYTSAARTRAYESAMVTNLAPWYNQAAGSFKVEFSPGKIGIGNTNLAMYTRSAAAIANSLVIVRRGSGANEMLGLISNPAGSVQMTAAIPGVFNEGDRVRACVAYTLNSAAFSAQGSAPFLDNTVEMPTPDWLVIGSNGNNSQSTNGHIHSIQYYPLRLSNSQVQVATV